MRRVIKDPDRSESVIFVLVTVASSVTVASVTVAAAAAAVADRGRLALGRVVFTGESRPLGRVLGLTREHPCLDFLGC